MPIAGGWLADTVGAKRVVTISMVLSFIANALIPVTARTDVWLLFTMKVLDGIAQAMVYPGLYVIIGRWTPPEERGMATSATYAGACFGFIASSYVAAFLCSMSFNGGWPLPFYFFSCIGLVFCFFWNWFHLDNPDRNPRISVQEKKHIQSWKQDKHQSQNPSLSWSGMLTSAPFWAFFISYTAFQLGYFFGHSNVPMFFTTILNLNVKVTCLMVSIAYLTQMLVFIISGIVAHYLMSRGKISILLTRKLMTFLSLFLPAVLFTIVGYFGANPVVGTLCIIGALGAYGFAGSGIETNVMDISPNHTGLVSGIIFVVSNGTGFAGPAILGKLLETENSMNQWRIIFIIIAVVHIFGLVIFLMFGDVKQQEWDKGKSSRDQNEQITILILKKLGHFEIFSHVGL
ncbi:sialin-like [Antedon mediterranea]|uniref:sialin-like n=1 Tax=Antedon mediterranea TaxID=105859 RepID=UPI003AF6021C